MVAWSSLKLGFVLAAQAGIASAGAFYNGYNSVSHLFVFGASLDSTDVPGTPITGVTTAYGPNLPKYLTTNINEIAFGGHAATIALHNFASPGATTKTSIIPASSATLPAPFVPVGYTPRDWDTQIGTDFWNTWTQNGQAKGWTSNNAVFLFTASNTGNDVLNGFHYSDRSSRLSQSISVITQRFNDLYNVGARNFIWLDVAPAELIPKWNKDPKQSSLAQYVKDYQASLDYIRNILASKSGVTFFHPNTTGQIRQIVANPGSFGYTAGYKDTTNYCSALVTQGYTPNPDADNDGRNQCPNGWVAKQWMFHDEVHYTYPTHKVIGQTTYICMLNNNGC